MHVRNSLFLFQLLLSSSPLSPLLLLRLLLQSLSFSFSLWTLCCGRSAGRGGVVWCVENFLFLSFLSLFPSPPSRSHAPVCRSQHAFVCRFKTSPCVDTCGPVAGTHGDVLNRHTEACWDPYTFLLHFFQRAAHTPTQHTVHQREMKMKREDRRERDTLCGFISLNTGRLTRSRHSKD